MNNLKLGLKIMLLCGLLLNAPLKAQKVRSVTVDSFDDLVRELNSNITIRLKAKRLTIDKQKGFLANPKMSYEPVLNGKVLQIKDVQNLTIIGDLDIPSKIISNTPEAYVLSFLNCENIRLENLEIGHAPPKGVCLGGVLAFNTCKGITIQNTNLFGSGSEGLTLDKVEESRFDNVLIRSCTKSIMTLTNCTGLNFKACRFNDNQGYDLINVFDSEKIDFNNCTFDLNQSGEGRPYEHYALFNAPLSLNVSTVVVSLEDCLIEDNRSQYFCRSEAAINLKDCTFENNIFEKKYSSGQ